MSLTKLNIPDSIKVGFQNRQGTYTGKLAYVIYKDKKGKLRKEKSWTSWCDSNIPAQEFENEPISGFVLNKKVGETRYGWNPRKAWVRVWDPRDFEFEISVNNLVFILEECSAIKGKGLEGEFVYAWDKADLVLLPVSSQEYSASAEHTAMQTQRVTKNDMAEGCMYLGKDGNEFLYLGRQPIYYTTQSYVRDKEPTITNRHGYRQSHYGGSYVNTKHTTKKHIFVSLDKKFSCYGPHLNDYNQIHYWFQPGFTKLAQRLTEEPDPRFAAEFDKWKRFRYAKEPKKKTKTKAKKS